MDIGIHIFGELVSDPHTHQQISAPERLKNVLLLKVLPIARIFPLAGYQNR